MPKCSCGKELIEKHGVLICEKHFERKHMLDSRDDVAEQQRKMLEAINTISELTEQLIELGKLLNDAKGKYSEVKARIKLQKEIINGLKITIRAEANTLY